MVQTLQYFLWQKVYFYIQLLCIDATIPTGQKIQCLPLAGFFVYWFLDCECELIVECNELIILDSKFDNLQYIASILVKSGGIYHTREFYKIHSAYRLGLRPMSQYTVIEASWWKYKAFSVLKLLYLLFSVTMIRLTGINGLDVGSFHDNHKVAKLGQNATRIIREWW